MPPFLETLSNVSPFKWAIVAVEGGMWRGFTAADMLLPCGILLGVGAVAFVIGVKRLRWE
jgi:ABC-2 type transport system permease protein